MSHIFISYSRQDEEYIISLIKALENEGFNVWFDRNMRVGAEWVEVIEEKINDCDAFILVMSEKSKQSRWVKVEVLHAINLKKPIFPLILQGVRWMIVQDMNCIDVTNRSLPKKDFFNQIGEFVKRRKASVKTPASANKKNKPQDKLQTLPIVSDDLAQPKKNKKKEPYRKIEERVRHLESIESDVVRVHAKSVETKKWMLLIAFALFASYAYANDNRFFLFAIFSTVGFWMLDSYFLQVERKLRGLYNDVARISKNPIEIKLFSKPLQNYRGGIYSFWSTFTSFSILPWYMILISIAIFSYLLL